MPVFLQVKNRAVSSLSAAITDIATSLSVVAGEGAKFPLPGNGFHITIDDEILICTARSTDELTVTRAQEGTTAAAHSAGATVELRITAKLIEDITGNLLALEAVQLVPTESSLLWECVRGAQRVQRSATTGYPVVCFPTSYADKAIRCLLGSTFAGYLCGRVGTTFYDSYSACLNSGAAAADNLLRKIVAAAVTTLGTEAVDIDPSTVHDCRLSCLGTAIKNFREDMVTAKISVTDTSLTTGYFGLFDFSEQTYERLKLFNLVTCTLEAAASPVPKVLAYFEVPIIGSGTELDPYQAKMPEFIAEAPPFGKTNKFALTHSSLIPTDDRGQPLHATALVRAFAQPDRQAHLNPETTCLTELKTLAGVKEIDKVNVKARAKGMDKKLKNEDLTPDSGWE